MTARARILERNRGLMVGTALAALAAALVLSATLGLGSLLLGLVAVVPMLGHGSWHAYRALIDTSSMEARESSAAPLSPGQR